MATSFKNPIFLKRLRFVSDSPDDKVCVKQDRKVHSHVHGLWSTTFHGNPSQSYRDKSLKTRHVVVEKLLDHK